MTTVTIRKDNWIPSRPWFADIKTDDGFEMRGWMGQFRTKNRMLSEIAAAADPGTVVVDHNGKELGTIAYIVKEKGLI